MKFKNASEYFYGCSYTEWENLPYFEAIELRVKKAREVFMGLYKDQSGKTGIPFEDQLRIFKVKKAWDDNQRLLDERSETL
jgi:hypothetical protein